LELKVISDLRVTKAHKAAMDLKATRETKALKVFRGYKAIKAKKDKLVLKGK
jgi:hypothetical protein